jgi:hypothetical protein
MKLSSNKFYGILKLYKRCLFYHFFQASLISNIAQTIRKPKEGNNTLISWMVSNCGGDGLHSDRDVFVRKLQSFLKVDVYGDCGLLKVEQ